MKETQKILSFIGIDTNKNNIRSFDLDEKLLFVGKDICQALDLPQYEEVLSQLKNEYKMGIIIDGEKYVAITDQGLYSIIDNYDTAKTIKCRNKITENINKFIFYMMFDNDLLIES